MSHYQARCLWQRRDGDDFLQQRYSRAHTLHFDGGAVVRASSSPSVVPPPWSDPAGVDPEEMFVASLASCHMLWFLSLAAKAGFAVAHYDDDAIGTMARNTAGQLVMTEVILRPQVRFDGSQHPSATELDSLHHHAHEECFIANSVKTEVRVLPR